MKKVCAVVKFPSSSYIFRYLVKLCKKLIFKVINKCFVQTLTSAALTKVDVHTPVVITLDLLPVAAQQAGL